MPSRCLMVVWLTACSTIPRRALSLQQVSLVRGYHRIRTATITISTAVRPSQEEEEEDNRVKEGSISQPIVGYFVDDEGDWVAKLHCGHNQHVRHNPPMTERPWVLTQEGRDKFLGYPLHCKLCISDHERGETMGVEQTAESNRK